MPKEVVIYIPEFDTIFAASDVDVQKIELFFEDETYTNVDFRCVFFKSRFRNVYDMYINAHIEFVCFL